LRFEERGHVLDADGIAAEILESFGHLDKLLDRVQRRNGVTKGALRVLAGAPNSLQGAAQITDVVEGVEDPKDIHAVLGRLSDEAIDDSILVVAIAEQILAAEKHLEPSVRHEFAKGTQALPGILVEEADAGIISRPAPALRTPVTGPVDVLTNRRHVL